MQPLAKLLEAALFAASRPLTLEELASLDPGAGEMALRASVEATKQGKKKPAEKPAARAAKVKVAARTSAARPAAKRRTA